MNYLDNIYRQRVIEGANLLGTGGGGTIGDATPLLKKIKNNIQLISLPELNDEAIICTVFGVGGKQVNDPVKASLRAFETFQKLLGKKISAIIPVESGPESLATAFFIADLLSIPVVDSDIVGMRCAPEIYLESISVPNLTRTPLAVSNGAGFDGVLLESQNLEQLEIYLRTFAVTAGGDAFVAGYPLTINQIKKVVPDGTISICNMIGEDLQKLKSNKLTLMEFSNKFEFNVFDIGEIMSETQDSDAGFETGIYTIKSEKGAWEVVYKNENIVLLKNKKVILTCPDSICLLNVSDYTGVNNFESNKNKTIAILGRKAIPIWRSSNGRTLFSPRKIGLNYKQKLLV